MQAKGAGAAGMTKQSMNEMMARAQKLPDSELADVLAGKSMQVPQFAAMLAAMGRDSLRTAVAGAQAGQAKKPSAKDQMLAKMSPQPQAPAGLDVLPAENMEQMGQGMADGGIVAFSGEDGSVVEEDRRPPSERAMDEYVRRIRESALFNRQGATQAASTSRPSVAETDPQARADRDALLATGRYVLDAAGSIVEAPFRALGTASDYLINRPLRAAGVPIPRVPSQFRYGAEEPKAPTAGETIGPQGMAPIRQGEPEASSSSAANTPPAGNQPPGVAPRASGVGAPSAAVQQPQMPEARKSPIDALLAPTEDIAKQVASSKNQAQGEFLMQMGASLMNTPNLGVALSKGVQAGLPGLAANRKEINAIQKDQRDYRLNLSKAQEAAAQGRDDLAFKYADLAEKAQYHAGIIAVSGARAAGAGGNLSAKQLQTATANANKALENELKRLGPRARLFTPEQRQTFMENELQRQLSMLQSGTVPAPVGPQFQEPPSGAVTRP